MRNHTSVFSFILQGLTDNLQMQVLTFISLIIIYMLNIIGNLVIITLILVDSHLKTAMYFFLQNFSFLKISFTSACIPRFLYSILTGGRTITYNTCLSQIFFTYMFGVTEFFLLVSMSYDHYVAICKPLHYMTIMNHRFCKMLIFCCWITTFLIVFPLFCLGLNLEFCDSVIDHFFCDVYPLLKISCSDPWIVEEITFACCVLIFIMPLTCVVLSYISIIRTVLRFPSAQQRTKAFSPCSSHFIVVSITYGSCIFVYIKPLSKDEMTINKKVVILTTSISPMLNPFIYTLRNKQVKQAFSDLLERILLVSKN
ncbi:olfactory receptor 6C2-like [Bubalus kerabau]|uniref:olfactory receptor 6C2-like n=1 Tax=Bubalus carabanensis TaxID=3119969 RepID=UPI00244E5C8D|nr:olfactory receptor 6C2-like [Bubalus carabanensis]